MTNDKIKYYYLPLAWLYGVAITLRNKLFDLKILPVEKFEIPVISVGNLAVGGTGKTPHVEYIIQLLKNKYRIAVLSRGYKRKTRGFRLADASADSRTIGDEPLQIFKKFPDIVVAVDANRRRGIRRLLALPATIRPEVVVLDDGFQHRYVQPSLSILLTEFDRPFFKDRLLPAGRLRESAKNVERSDIVIFTKCPPNEIPEISKLWKTATKQSVFYSSFHYKEFQPIFEDSFQGISDYNNCAMLLVTGIARPAPFIRHLNSLTIGLQILLFSDHHDFCKNDFAKIKSVFDSIKRKEKIIVSTEKDAARLASNPEIPDELRGSWMYMPIEIVFAENGENSFTKKIEEHVAEFIGNRCMAPSSTS